VCPFEGGCPLPGGSVKRGSTVHHTCCSIYPATNWNSCHIYPASLFVFQLLPYLYHIISWLVPHAATTFMVRIHLTVMFLLCHSGGHELLLYLIAPPYQLCGATPTLGIATGISQGAIQLSLTGRGRSCSSHRPPFFVAGPYRYTADLMQLDRCRLLTASSMMANLSKIHHHFNLVRAAGIPPGSGLCQLYPEGNRVWLPGGV